MRSKNLQCEKLQSEKTQGKKMQGKEAHSKLALARLSKLAALTLLGPKKGCALARAHDFGIFCAGAHFRVRKSQNLPKNFNDIQMNISCQINQFF